MLIKNGFKYFAYSELNPFEEIVYYEKISRFVSKLNYEYPCFDDWFNNLFIDKYTLKNDREILLCERDKNIAGLAILKNTYDEKKICTLRVDKNFQKMSIGSNLMELSFEWLETDKPLITLHKSKEKQFKKLFERYDFKLEDKKWGYYSLFSTELAYNGNLQGQSKIYINKFEIIDFYKVIKTYFDKGIFNLDYIIQEYIKNCKEKTVYYGI